MGAFLFLGREAGKEVNQVISYKSFLFCAKVCFPDLLDRAYVVLWKKLKKLAKEGQDPVQVMQQWQRRTHDRAFDVMRECGEYDGYVLEEAGVNFKPSGHFGPA